MTNNKLDDFFEIWQKLMEEWNTASTLLGMALATPEPTDADGRAQRDLQIEGARARQLEVKARIDSLVAERQSGRNPSRDGVFMGVIHAPGEALPKLNDSPRKAANGSKDDSGR